MVNSVFKPGVLNYGDLDDSIIFRSPLTSLASMTSAEVGSGTIIELGSGATFDPILGLKPGAAGGYRIQNMANYALLDNEFHVTYEIESEWLAYNDPTNGSTGYVPGATSAAYTLNATSGGAMTIMQKTVGGALQSWIKSTIYQKQYRDFLIDTGVTVNALIHSAQKERFSVVDVWMDSGLIVLAINKTIIAAGQISGNTNAGLFVNQYLGSDRGISGFMGDYYVRNLQIAARAPAMQGHYKLAKIGILSDSLFNTDSPSSVYRDNMTSHVIRRELLGKGLRAGKMYVDVNGGFTAFTTGANDISNRVAALLLENPTMVMLSMGTNDVITGLTINAAWDTDVKTNVLDPIIADDKVEVILVGTVTSLVGNTSDDTVANRAALAQVNAYYAALESYSSKIRMVDRYSVLGAETPPEDTYIGQLNGASDNLHYAAIGLEVCGIEYADVAYDSL